LDHVVGFLGDGINDAPALAEADVGISVDTATDIAKESADVILLEKSLMVIAEAVDGWPHDVRKHDEVHHDGHLFQLWQCVLDARGVGLLPFLPMLPIHILTQNLLYDISQTTIPWTTWTRSSFLCPSLEHPFDSSVHGVYGSLVLDL